MSSPTVYFGPSEESLEPAGRTVSVSTSRASSLNSPTRSSLRACATRTARPISLPWPARETHVIVVKLDVTSETDAQEAAKLVKERAGKVDVLIPCAGDCHPGYLRDQDLDEARDMFTVNTFGPMILLRAFLPLLLESQHPIFVPLSSMAGSMTCAMPIPTGYYGASKAALNFLTVKAHTEHEKLCAFVCSPGLVMTDMTTQAMSHPDLPRPPEEYIVDVEESVAGMIKVIRSATRDTHGGKFIDYKGQPVPW